MKLVIVVMVTWCAPAFADEPAAPAGPRGGIGIGPGSVQVGDLVVPTDTDGGFDASQGDEFAFQFLGFLRLPTRVGVGGKVHTPPHIPDGTYTDWQYTNNLTGPWTEVRLAYGNARVVANVVVAAYDLSDSSYRNPQAQLGVNQAFVTINQPRLFGDGGGLVWHVGGFSSRYGAAGRYDAGKYDTYLFGATHAAGETVTAFYNLSPRLTLHAEHGVGAKLEVAPLVSGVPPAPFFPYAGEVQQGDTLLHHAHAGATWALPGGGDLTAAAHHMIAWTDDADAVGERDGRISTVGAELKLIDARFGDGYLGFAQLRARNPDRVAGAIETLHSFEGWNLRDNYFGANVDAGGRIDTLLVQHTFSLGRWMWHPREFYGQARDLLIAGFGMYNRVRGDDPGFAGPRSKLKLGTEITVLPRAHVGVALRYDLVQPDMDDSTRSFQVVSPKLILRTEYASHEQIVIQYSRYFGGDGVRLAWPHEGLRPDKNVFAISAVMWW